MTERDPEHVKRVEAWFKADKEHDLRLTYSLNQDSVVLDVGAYDGAWARQIHRRYKCRVICFEPVKSCFEKLKANVGHIEKITLLNVGVKNKTGFTDIYANGDASSIWNVPEGPVAVEHIQIMSILDIAKAINFIDLIKMNIEGDEYEVLDAIIDAGIQSKFGNYQIQFHRDIPEYQSRRDRIVAELAKTHKRTYCFDYVWENWELK